MVNLQVKPLAPEPGAAVANLPYGASIEEEIDAMVSSCVDFDPSEPDVVLSLCMGYMARCTEFYIRLVRLEASSSRAKFLRTMQLQKLMDLLDFEFKAASRLIEVRRQELETSR